MGRAIRPSTPADADAIVALLMHAGLRPSIGPRDLNWRYWLPRADWTGPRSYLLTEDSEPIAHAALVPGAWLDGTRRLGVVHVIDWAARPGAIGAGVMLMRHIGQQVDALLAIGGTAETLKLLPNLGFRAVGSVPGYVRTLHPLRLLRGRRGWARLRGLLRVARGFAATLAGPPGGDEEYSVRRVLPGRVAEVSAALPAACAGIAVAERTVSGLEHALECPIVPFALYLLERAGRARGYFLLASTPGQVRIADCWAQSDAPEEWRALIACAVARAAADPQAAEIICWANDPLTATALEACGFRAPVANLMQMRSGRGDALPAQPLRVQMLESDAAYLHRDPAEFWT